MSNLKLRVLIIARKWDVRFLMYVLEAACCQQIHQSWIQRSVLSVICVRKIFLNSKLAKRNQLLLWKVDPRFKPEAEWTNEISVFFSRCLEWFISRKLVLVSAAIVLIWGFSPSGRKSSRATIWSSQWPAALTFDPSDKHWTKRTLFSLFLWLSFKFFACFSALWLLKTDVDFLAWCSKIIPTLCCLESKW